MKKLLTVFVLVLSGFISFAQNGAKIAFKAPNNTIDYGIIKKGKDSGIRVFEFTNTGNQPLIITDVKSTCGCMVPKKPTAPIMPGKKGTIEVKYNMDIGKISKTVTVKSNAKNYEDGTVTLKIKGQVVNE